MTTAPAFGKLKPKAAGVVGVPSARLFNDQYGHQGGDACLKRVAQTIRDWLNRSGDTVAWIGGEEFVVVLPGADVRAAAGIADSIRQRVIKLGILHTPPARPQVRHGQRRHRSGR